MSKTSILGNEVGKKKRKEKEEEEEDRHVEKEDRVLFTWNNKERAQQKTLLLWIRTGNSTVKVCMCSIYFYLQVFLQCVSYLEHIIKTASVSITCC